MHIDAPHCSHATYVCHLKHISFGLALSVSHTHTILQWICLGFLRIQRCLQDGSILFIVLSHLILHYLTTS